jgi:hypothetical protein
MSLIIKIVGPDYFYTVTFTLIVIRDMKKQKGLQIALLFSVCFACLCSNSLKPSTNLGRQIVSDIDSTLIDLNRNVKAFSDSLKIFSSSSMRDINDTLPPGYQYNPPFIVAGRNVGADTEDVVAYLEFRPSAFKFNGTIQSAMKNAIVDSVVLNVRRFRISTLSNPVNDTTKLDVDSCVVLDRFSNLSILGRQTDSAAFPRGFLTNNILKLGTLSVNMDSAEGDTMLSLRLDSAIYTTKFKNAVKDTVGFSDTEAFALCLAPDFNCKGIARFMSYNGDATSPNLSVYFHNSVTDTARRMYTLSRDHASYTVLEPDSSALCGSPICSWETARRTVYKIDVSSITAFMDSAAPEGKKYVVLQKADVRIPISKSVSDMRLDSILVYYTVLDTQARNFYDLAGTGINPIGTFYIRDSISRDTTYVIPLAKMLQHLVVDKNDKSVNLYLWIHGQNSPYNTYGPSFIQVAWKPEALVKLDAVVTNPR